MNSFHIGQVVVCVDASNFPYERGLGEFPVEGGVYTIRNFSAGENKFGETDLALRLAEIVNPILEFECDGITEMTEVAFLSHRFRPAKKTSLEVFDAVLKGLPLCLEEA
jgi:hypothetical protein